MRVICRLALLVLCAAPRLYAATFIVPEDRSLVTHAKMIVVATPLESHTRWTNPWIETVTTMRVEEPIRGALTSGETFEVVELGGEYGDVAYVVPGAPRYPAGERVLLFLGRTDRGEWTSKAMAVGKFAFSEDDTLGRTLLLRDAAELTGWDENGAQHVEPQRDAAKFLAYVRGVARGQNPAVDYIVPGDGRRARTMTRYRATTMAAVSTYLLQLSDGLGMRWPTPTATFLSHGTQPGALNGGLTALQRGLAAWTTNGSSNISYTYGGTTTVTQGLNSADRVNSVQFNDPAGEIPGAYTGQGGDVLAIGGAWAGSATHTFNGETFHSILEADLVVQNGISGAGLTGNGFDHVLAHELGHTLGFRHSNEPPAGGTSATNALMNSTVNFNNDATGAALLAWDQEAAAAVYGSGGSPQPQPQPTPNPNPNPVPIPVPGQPPSCTGPAILAQPQSQALTGTSGVTLSVVAASTTDINYQWYAGAPGVTSSPVANGGAAEIVVKPTVTTSYWVRVFNSCTSVDSVAAVVTVGNCPIVSLNDVTQSTTVVRGTTVTLAAAATGGSVSYAWFNGASGDTSHPLATSASIDVTPQSTSQYWVNVSNSCGASIASGTITITVAACNAPALVVPPGSGDFVAGDTITLSAFVSGTAPLLYEWTQNGSAISGANASTITVGPLFANTTFGLRVSNTCGNVTATPVTYRLVSSCVAPVITAAPHDQDVPTGSTALLTVAASGTSLVYRWYQGQVFDFTHPVGASTPAFVTDAVTQPVQYWVLVQNSCGSARSDTVTVTPAMPARHRGVRH